MVYKKYSRMFNYNCVFENNGWFLEKLHLLVVNVSYKDIICLVIEFMNYAKGTLFAKKPCLN